MLWPHHQIQFWDAAQERFAFLLGNATGDNQRQVRLLVFAFGLSAQIGVNFLLGVIPNRAGVVEDQIGLFGRI